MHPFRGKVTSAEPPHHVAVPRDGRAVVPPGARRALELQHWPLVLHPSILEVTKPCAAVFECSGALVLVPAIHKVTKPCAAVPECSSWLEPAAGTENTVAAQGLRLCTVCDLG